MAEASDNRPLLATKPFQIEGRHVASKLAPKALFGVVPGLVICIVGLTIRRNNPHDLALAPTLLWAGGVIVGLSILAPLAVALMAKALPRTTQHVEFFSHEFDVFHSEGASKSIPYSDVKSIWEDGMMVCIEVEEEVVEIPYLAFVNRWEMERAVSLVRSKLPDTRLKSLAS